LFAFRTTKIARNNRAAIVFWRKMLFKAFWWTKISVLIFAVCKIGYLRRRFDRFGVPDVRRSSYQDGPIKGLFGASAFRIILNKRRGGAVWLRGRRSAQEIRFFVGRRARARVPITVE
jgi:hypothetical protein